MSVEEWARQVIQLELNRPVVHHDDGSRPAMFDLRVGDQFAPDIAIECVGAVDSIRTETWNLGPARGPLRLPIGSDWIVVLKPNARIKHLKLNLAAVLRTCKQHGIDGFFPVDFQLQRYKPSLFQALDSLGIDSIHCTRPHGNGTVHLTMTGRGGAVDIMGRHVPIWVAEFLRAPERADVLSKLKGSGARECHVFIPVAFGGASWEVESYLGRPIECLPDLSPDLPQPIVGVWISYSAQGIRWDGLTWRVFDAR